MCARGGDLWWSARDAAAICIVNVVGQQQQQEQEHQQQRNGAVSILVSRTQLHHRADRDPPSVYNEI